MLLIFGRITQRVRKHPATRFDVLRRAMQVAVQPQVGQWDQVVVGIAEAGRAGPVFLLTYLRQRWMVLQDLNWMVAQLMLIPTPVLRLPLEI